jgi:hypothetical protein
MKSICFPPSAFCLLLTADCLLNLKGLRVGGTLGPYRSLRQDGHWSHLHHMGARSRSHSRESGNPLGKPSEMRCRRTGFPLSRE